MARKKVQCECARAGVQQRRGVGVGAGEVNPNPQQYAQVKRETRSFGIPAATSRRTAVKGGGGHRPPPAQPMSEMREGVRPTRPPLHVT